MERAATSLLNRRSLLRYFIITIKFGIDIPIYCSCWSFLLSNWMTYTSLILSCRAGSIFALNKLFNFVGRWRVVSNQISFTWKKRLSIFFKKARYVIVHFNFGHLVNDNGYMCVDMYLNFHECFINFFKRMLFLLLILFDQ